MKEPLYATNISVLIFYCKEPRIESQPAGRYDITLFVAAARSIGYIGWRNRFLGSLNVYGLCSHLMAIRTFLLVELKSELGVIELYLERAA